VVDLYKSHADEAMAQYRHFANLRALITWFPVTIIFAVFGFFSKSLSNLSPYGYFTSIVALLIVLSIIFWAQFRLQKVQHRALSIGELAQRRYLQQSNEELTYNDLRNYEKGRNGPEFNDKSNYVNRRFRFDGSSKALAAFFVMIFLVYSGILVIQSGCGFSLFWPFYEVCVPVENGGEGTLSTGENAAGSGG
jgi:hypothetical protein